MVIEPHDLLKIDAKHLISHTPIPDWAIQALNMAPYVVVRRAHAPKGQIAVGIRGKARNERFGMYQFASWQLCRMNQAGSLEHVLVNLAWSRDG